MQAVAPKVQYRITRMMRRLTAAQRLKLDILERGVGVGTEALAALTIDGTRPLVEHDYVTTGGLTLVIDHDIYINAPVDYSFCGDPAATVGFEDGTFVLENESARYPAQVLSLPGYLWPKDDAPRGMMTHADRIRMSPIDGCACSCRFCDWPLLPYATLPIDGLIDGLKIALGDTALPPRHVLVSGGTPRGGDREFMNTVYEETVRSSPLPVDVMLMPRDGHELIDRLVDAGVAGFAINLEVFSRETAAALCPNKEFVGLDGYADFISHAVERTGGSGSGRVRSLLLVGLEPEETTLEGVRFLAELGCDPALSPFRPAENTELADVPPPTADFMESVYLEASGIAEQYGVELGPRCIPCQHNTIAFPDGDGFYYS